MQRPSLRGMLSGAMTLVLACAAGAPALAQESTIKAQAAAALGWRDAEVVALNVPFELGNSALVRIPTVDGELRARLYPHSVRSSNHFQVQVVNGTTGETTIADPGPIRTFRGEVIGVPGAVVAGSLVDGAFTARIFMPDVDDYIIEPIAERVPGADFNAHAIARSCDIHEAMGFCATNTAIVDFGFADDDRRDGPSAERGVSNMRLCEIAIDSDAQWRTRFASAAQAQTVIETIMNLVDAQYSAQVGITYQITTIIIREGTDPYQSGGVPTTNASTYLNQFRSFWNANQGAIVRDVAHLFTGRNIAGSTIGIAFVGVICTSSAYGLSQATFSNTCNADLVAHELGHNWNAPHCSCPSHTMNPSLTCARNFAAVSINTIISFKNTRNCLSVPPPPTGPDPFDLSLPAEGTTGVSLSPFMLWTVADGAAEYHLQIDNDPDFSSPAVNITTSLTSYQVLGDPLQQGTQYFWRVVASNVAGSRNSNPSIGSFVTTGPAPGFLVLVSPADSADFPDGDNIEFVWSQSTAAHTYKLEIDNDSDFSSPEVIELDIPASANPTVHVMAPSGVLTGGMWHWRVTAQNFVGQTVSTPASRPFTVTPPASCDGDADGNFVVDTGDITYIVLRLGLTAPNDEGADVDNSGVVDIDDLTFVILRLGNMCN